jgi:hypothetical protein
LQRLCVSIHARIAYRVREEPGVQDAAETLKLGTGSCRDSGALFIRAARRLGRGLSAQCGLEGVRLVHRADGRCTAYFRCRCRCVAA